MESVQTAESALELARMQKAIRTVSSSPTFKSLVARRWAVTSVLLGLLFLSYYGFILLVAWDRPFMARKVGQFTTAGIPIGVAVIVFAWLLTCFYVLWANRSYDPDVERLRHELKK